MHPGRRPAGELGGRFTPRFVRTGLQTREKARLPLATTAADDTRGAGPPAEPHPKSSRRPNPDSSDHRLLVDSALHPVLLLTTKTSAVVTLPIWTSTDPRLDSDASITWQWSE